MENNIGKIFLKKTNKNKRKKTCKNIEKIIPTMRLRK